VNANPCCRRPFVTERVREREREKKNPPHNNSLLLHVLRTVRVIMIRHVIRRHKTPITIVMLTIMSRDRAKGDRRGKYVCARARGSKHDEIKTCTFPNASDPIALERNVYTARARVCACTVFACIFMRFFKPRPVLRTTVIPNEAVSVVVAADVIN